MLCESPYSSTWFSDKEIFLYAAGHKAETRQGAPLLFTAFLLDITRAGDVVCWLFDRAIEHLCFRLQWLLAFAVNVHISVMFIFNASTEKISLKYLHNVLKKHRSCFSLEFELFSKFPVAYYIFRALFPCLLSSAAHEIVRTLGWTSIKARCVQFYLID